MKKVVLNYLVIAVLVVAAAFTSCGGSGSSGGGSSRVNKSSGKITMTTEAERISFGLDGSGVATVDWGDGTEKVSLTLMERWQYGGVRFEHTYPNKSIRTITINGENITGLTHINYCITSLDVSRCTELTKMQCFGSFASFDVSKNTALTKLELHCDGLTSFDASKNTALTELYVAGGNFKSFDVSKNTALTALEVINCQLTSAALNTLFGTLHSNTVQPAQGMYSLNTSKNKALRVLNASYNQLKVATLNVVTGTLQSNTILLAQGPSSFDVAKIIKIGGNPGAADCDRSIAERKGWTVRDN